MNTTIQFQNNENLIDERIQQMNNQVEAEMRREAQEQEELLKEPEIEGYDLSDDEIGQIYPEEVNDIFPFENKSLFEGENPQTQKENPENNPENQDKDQTDNLNALSKAQELIENLKKKDEPLAGPNLDLIRADAIKEHLTKFGTGNKEIAESIPKIKQVPVDPVAEAENFKKITILRNKNKKSKLEDRFFIFSTEDEVRKADLFDSQRLKKDFFCEAKKEKLTKQKKLKQKYIMDFNSLYFFFLIPEKRIIEPTEKVATTSDMDNLGAVNEISPEGLPINIKNLEPGNFNLDINMGTVIENTAKVDTDYQKKFGRLYKTFDVRYLKGKIWESINEVRNFFNVYKLFT